MRLFSDATSLPADPMLARALSLAEFGRGGTYPNPMVGSVVVRDGEIVGGGFHERAGGPHAEILALAAAGEKARDATVYVTLEPCLMCAGAILHARIERLVFGAVDPQGGAAVSLYRLFEDLRLNHAVAVTEGILRKACADILSGFFQEKRLILPP